MAHKPAPCAVHPALGPLLSVLLAAGLALPALDAGAESYVCTTASGSTVSADRPPLECKDRDIRVLNSDGSLKKILPAPLTRDQRQARDRERREQEEKEREDRAQASRDRAMLETYGSVEEIDRARKRTVSGQQILVDRADQKLTELARQRKRLDDEAEFYAKRELPAALKRAYEDNDALRLQQEKARVDAQAEIRKINEKFEADKTRYVDLERAAAEAAAARERAASGISEGGDSR